MLKSGAMNTTKHLRLVLLLCVMLILSACNLSDSPPPPSLVPRATSTPPPTIGYSTLAPNEYPTGATQVAAVPQIDALAVSALINQVAPDRLFVYVNSLMNMRTRHVNSSASVANQGIGAAQRYVMGEFNRIREQSYQQAFSVFTHEFPIAFAGINSIGQNIVGVLQGYETGAGVIVLGAHYDSITLDFENAEANAPGANDNASGVGALLEIARILSQKRHRATIMFVAFSAEEIQRQGSIAFVRDYLQGANIEVTAMLNMDIIGSGDSSTGAIDNEEIRIFSAEPNESRSRQLARGLSMLCQINGAPLKIIVQPLGDREGRYSDHLSFSDAGYPAVRFIETLEEIDRHHTDRDTMEDIDTIYYMRATQTVLTCVNALADGPRPPRSISLREAGGGLRTLVWERTPDAAGYVVALRPPGALTYETKFETVDNTVTWEGFVGARFVGVAIAAKDAAGVVGPFSGEFGIAN